MKTILSKKIQNNLNNIQNNQNTNKNPILCKNNVTTKNNNKLITNIKPTPITNKFNKISNLKSISQSQNLSLNLTISTMASSQCKLKRFFPNIQKKFAEPKNYLYIDKKLDRTRSTNKLIDDEIKSNYTNLNSSNKIKNNNENFNSININLEKKFNNVNNIKENSLFNLDNNKIKLNEFKKQNFKNLKTNENIESKIINDTNIRLLNLKEKYKKLFNHEPKLDLLSPDINNNININNEFKLNKKASNIKNLQQNINDINLDSLSINIQNLEINKKNYLENTYDKQDYKQLLNTYQILEYGSSILEEYFNKQENLKNVLQNHSITPNMRMKMVDWIVEIYYNYKTSDNTFFTTINIMDRFFFNTNIKYTPDDLQLIGMCSVFIASKFCEIYPIKLKFLIEKIGYNKYNKEQILKMEENILSCLNYDILRPTLLDFCNYYLQEIFYYFENNYNIKSKILYQYLTNFIQNSKINLYFDNLNYFEKFNDSKKFTENYQKFFRLVVIYLLKMCCHDYDIINEKISLISASCIIVAFKITGQINNEKYINKIILDKLINMSKEDEITLIILSEKILKRAQDYQKYYSGINNLYRTHFETLNYVQNTK